MEELWRILIMFRFIAKLKFNLLITYLSRTIIPRKKLSITINQGTLEGYYYTTILSNKPYVSFLGIPYAKPPIGNLRFKSPVEHPGWSGVLKASSDGNKSLQYDIVTNQIIGKEDCLYLNIFVPKNEINEKKPVMVFIHGGGFNSGSGSSLDYAPDYLLDENVIVVTINYRLGALGFLNLDIDECPGNMGLKDQLLALKWIKANIFAFEGDVDNITIFGESAGAASVHYHILSTQSKGLFHKAIMQSGCILNPWALSENHMEIACTLVKQLGCEKKNPKDIIKYLINIPAKDILKCTKLKRKEHFLDILFLPSIENEAVKNRFLSDHPKILSKFSLQTSPLPIISGINNMEGLLALEEYRMESLVNFHEMEQLRKYYSNSYDEKSINKIKDFYFHERYLNCETTRLEQICHLYGDINFIKDFHRGLHNFLEQNDAPVYNYEFKFDGDFNMLKNLLFLTRPLLRQSLKGACHADELYYLFYSPQLGTFSKVNSPEFRMCRAICKLWCNFAKTGNPNSQDFSFTWKNTSKDNPNYLSLDGDNTCMVNELLCGVRVDLWDTISE